MHDCRDGGHDHGGARHEHDCGERHSGPGANREGDVEHCEGRADSRRGGADTRFLQLEMSQALYAEAESVTKQAFRELLVEAAKERWRERFGDKIIELAHLAVDELMKDVRSSLDIEARIQERNQDRGPARERLRDIFTAGGAPQKGGDEREGGPPPRKRKR